MAEKTSVFCRKEVVDMNGYGYEYLFTVSFYIMSIISFEKVSSFLNSCSNCSVATARFDNTKEMRYRIIGNINADICDKKKPTIIPLTPLLPSPLRECSS